MALTVVPPRYPNYTANTQNDQYDVPGRTDIANAWDYNTHDAEILRHQTVLVNHEGRIVVLEGKITPTYALPISFTGNVVGLSYPDFLDSSVPFTPSLGMTSTNVHAAILESYSKQYKKTFIVADWVLSGDYYISVPHLLNTLVPNVTVRDSTDSVMVNQVEVVDANNVRIWVPSTPNLRFIGSVAVIKT
jgi:hypothetical protein